MLVLLLFFILYFKLMLNDYFFFESVIMADSQRSREDIRTYHREPMSQPCICYNVFELLINHFTLNLKTIGLLLELCQLY